MRRGRADSETIGDLDELHQALGRKNQTDLPVIAQLTIQHSAVTETGVDVYTALQAWRRRRHVVGTTAALAASATSQHREDFAAQSHAMLSAFPNAGFRNTSAARDLSASRNTGLDGRLMVDAGANIVGWCCGTGPVKSRPSRDGSRIVGRPAGDRPSRAARRSPQSCRQVRNITTAQEKNLSSSNSIAVRPELRKDPRWREALNSLVSTPLTRRLAAAALRMTRSPWPPSCNSRSHRLHRAHVLPRPPPVALQGI
jgi:hypothetical protein